MFKDDVHMSGKGSFVFDINCPISECLQVFSLQEVNIVSNNHHVVCADVLECDTKPRQVSAFMEKSDICYCYTQDRYNLLYV